MQRNIEPMQSHTIAGECLASSVPIQSKKEVRYAMADTTYKRVGFRDEPEVLSAGADDLPVDLTTRMATIMPMETHGRAA